MNDAEDCRVWAWSVCPIDGKFIPTTGIDIDSFISFMIENDGTTFYFHNAKFDTGFIIDWLFNHGYHWISGRAPKKPGEFTTLIGDMGEFYSLKIYFESGVTTILDSYKLIALKVADIPEAFGLEDSKLAINYNKVRPKGHNLQQKEIDYVVADTAIVAKALKIMLDSGLDKMTAASNAMSFYKNLVGSKFKKWFPSDIVSDEVIRQAYYGGAVMVNPKYQGKYIRHLRIFDVNSHFPAQLRYQYMPYGEPQRFEGKYNPNKTYPLYVQECSFECKLKRGYLPSLPANKGFLRKSKWVEQSDGEPLTYVLTNIDLDMLYEHYDVWNMKYYGGYMFRAQKGMFDEYIDYWMEKKETAAREGNAGMKYIAKLFLNSFYGKFGMNPIKKQKIPEFKDGVVSYYDSEPTIEEPIYVAVAAFTTAYARKITISSAQKNYDKFVYMDTDSLHLNLLPNEEPVGLELHPTKLGAWDNEYNADGGKYLHAKCYMDKNCVNAKGKFTKYIIKCAGMTDAQKTQITGISKFRVGLELEGKLVPKRVKGGIILQNTTFKIKEQ